MFVMWGSKGHAKVLCDIVNQDGQLNVCAFIENDRSVDSVVEGVPIYYGLQGYRSWLNALDDTRNYSAIAAIGGERGKTRRQFLALFSSDGLMTPSLIHPTASILSGCLIGRNCQILAHSVVGVDSRVGDACIVNTNASVDHNCSLESGVHIGPGATLCGEVFVGENSFVGAGSVVLPRVKLGKNSIIGSGSVVTRDVPDNVIAFGNPARVIKEKVVE